MANPKQPSALINREAEEALLGAALLDPHIFVDLKNITPDCFSEMRFRGLWAAGQELVRAGSGVDSITLPLDVLEAVGGAVGLLDLIAACPTAVNAVGYSKIVRGMRDRRTLELKVRLMGQATYIDDEGKRSALLAQAEALGVRSDDLGWTICNLTDAFAPRPPLEYAISGIFMLPSLNIVYGAPGSLKSMLMADASMSVAAGLPWLEPLPTCDVNLAPFGTTMVPVLWCDFDNGKRRTSERTQALAVSRGLAPDTPFFYVSMPSPWLNGSNAESVAGLIEHAKMVSAGLIVIDNLGTVSGGVDENSSEMIQVLANFRYVAEETGAAVVLIHHQRKATGLNTRAGETLRGFSGIEAAIDLALLVEREDRGSTVKVRSTKSRGEDTAPFGAIFTYDSDRATGELTSARFYGTPIVDDSKPARAKRTILDALETGDRLSQSDLVEKVKSEQEVGRNIALAALTDLVTAGVLTTESEQGGKRHATLYTLN